MSTRDIRPKAPQVIKDIIDMWIDFFKSPTKFTNWVSAYGISRGAFLTVLYTALLLFLNTLIPNLPFFAFSWLFGLAPIWLPIALVIGFWSVWIWYIQSLFLSGRNPILLEMRIPRNITKSPRAMEIAFTLFSISTGETTFLHRAWKGQTRPFFSFEIASFGGQVHFYIWTWKNYKSEIEAAIYGQYPEVELVEVEDYAMKFDFDPKKHAAFGCDWRLESYAVDPAGDGHSSIKADSFRINAYPPKSYIDFELDKDPKDEYRVDPLSTIIEFMGSIEPQEQIWAQIVMRKCGDIGILSRKEMDHEWQHMIEAEVDKIRKEALRTPGSHGDKPEDKGRFPHPTWKQTEQIRFMERHLGKYPFEVGARGVYISLNGHLHGPTYTGMRWLWKPIGNPMYQGHWRPRRWCNDFDYPWQDVNDIRWNLTLKRYFDAYRRRMFFHSPWIIPTNVVTNEILATMWRPVSNAITTPGLQRIPSAKAPAPPNLPT